MLHLRVVSPPDITSSIMLMLRSEPAVFNATLLPGRGQQSRRGREARGSILQLLLNLAVLAAVAIVGVPVRRAIWARYTRRSEAADLQKTGG